jgi:WD40 repeat protein
MKRNPDNENNSSIVKEYIEKLSGSGGKPKTPTKGEPGESNEDTLVLKGHDSPVLCCAFSPDGRRIVSGSEDHILKLWDAETGEELLTLEGHTSRVDDCSFSPDGERIVSAGSFDLTLMVWDAETGRDISTLEGHRDAVVCCAFSPDGKLIASSGRYDNTLKLWDAEAVGTDFAALASWPGPSFTETTFGGEDETWGIELSPCLVNSRHFGCFIRAKNNGLANSTTAQVQKVTMTVYYYE